jgi:mRNA interferase MazF
MKPGDIILIRFPQADLQTGKLRPALIVAITPGRQGDVLLAMITSQSELAVANFDEVIDPNDADYSATGLKVRSVVRLSRVATMAVGSIDARLGHISPARLRHIRGRIASWLAP